MAILQLRGAAFGAYMLARKSALRFKWTGAISSAIVGVLSGLVVVILAAIFPAKIGGSYAYYSASASLSGASFRTFFMAFPAGWTRRIGRLRSGAICSRFQ